MRGCSQLSEEAAALCTPEVVAECVDRDLYPGRPDRPGRRAQLYGFANGDPVNFSDPFGLCDNGKIFCPEQFTGDVVRGLVTVGNAIGSLFGAKAQSLPSDEDVIRGLDAMSVMLVPSPLGATGSGARALSAAAQELAERVGQNSVSIGLPGGGSCRSNARRRSYATRARLSSPHESSDRCFETVAGRAGEGSDRARPS
jgi:hypothetical protein